MKAKWIFTALFVWIGAGMLWMILVPETVEGLSATQLRMIAAVAGGVGLLLLVLLYIYLLRPVSIVNNGMDLLRAQDFSSRLVMVGQREADGLVEIFNTMLDRIKEERLRNIEQNHFLQLLIGESPLGIAILDFDGRVTLVNPAMLSMLEMDFAELYGRFIRDFDTEMARAIADTPQGETRTVRFSDTNIVRISRLDFLESGFRRPYIIVESLTKDVMQAEKEAYGKVIRLIAHEVNNTIGGVTSILETLSAIMEEEPDLLEAIESCHDRCASLSEFITSYADVVRIPQARLTTVNLNTSVERMLPFLDCIAGPAIRLSFSAAQPELLVKADIIMLEQVLVNLVKNAKESIEASTEAGGEINIRLSCSAPHIEVTDNGHGISAEAARNIFAPFFSTKRGGQGIGLMMVANIMRQHGCHFSLRTDAPDPSTPDIRPLTRFRITFPSVTAH